MLIHPQSVFLIVYSGGYCGEFLAWWLSQHPGAISSTFNDIGSNRYILQHKHNYVLDTNGTREKVFLVAHSGQSVSKDGFVVSDQGQHIIFYCDPKHHRFFAYLYLIKTLFFKYKVLAPPYVMFNQNHSDWEEFCQYLNGRDEFTGVEAENWINNRGKTSMKQWVKDHWLKSQFVEPVHPTTNSVNISNLMFGNVSACQAEICQQFDLTPVPELQNLVAEYHQRNIGLVEYYSGMPVAEFLDLSNDAATDIILQFGVNKI